MIVKSSHKVTDPGSITEIQHNGTRYYVYNFAGIYFVTKIERTEGGHEVEKHLGDDERDLYWQLTDKAIAYIQSQ